MAATGRATKPSADGTRGRILAAALDLFSELAVDGATTREIAARAGVTQPLLGVPTARRYRPPAAEVVEAHADAVLALIFRR